MGLLDWMQYRSTRGSILQQGEQQAKRFSSTCDYVAREFVRRNGLNTIPPPVWHSCLRSGTCPEGLTQAIRDLLMTHAVRDVSKEYAPTMVACALHSLGGTFKQAAAISLVKLIAPSQEKDTDVSVAAASILAQFIFLERGRKAAFSLRSYLSNLTETYLPDDHNYIWMTVEEVAELLNLE